MSAKPILPVIALDLFDEAMLFEIWAHMLSTLKSCFDVIVVKEKGEAQALLNNPSVKIAVANDTDTVAVLKSTRFLERGGTVIFAAMFPNFTRMDDFCKCFQDLGLSWKNGSYYRSDFFITDFAASRLEKYGAPDTCNAKALLAADVAPEDRIFTPSQSSHTQSLVFPTRQIEGDGLAEAAVALGRSRSGWVGYMGDVNGEERSSHILVAMLKWALAQ